MGFSKETFRKIAGTPSKEEFFERHKEGFHKCRHYVATSGKESLIGEAHTGMVADLGKSAELKKRKLF